ncbi:hypothetical protein GCM10010331_45380 [Streptomyces xanthochromogenes]|uniref:HNH endonuclease n=1 Tax=Streptomyces xanthochromogenes TaxID=67384 RepID=UPI00199E77DA|nr:HNH endonuclease [Streptomyces xanthochromogenes]GHB52667.1 hypothetical protein GCM10010331_45380 [Streptomyces xanthochromogenes]
MGTAEDFWARVEKTESCWLWRGGTRGNGYGTFWADRKRYYAHRYAFFLTHDHMPKGIVLHACDTPRCVRPSHLSDGTPADNVLDMWSKGRGKPPPVLVGEAHPHTRLTEATVLHIREQYASGQYSQRSLARTYGMDHASIGAIVRHETWRHIGGPHPAQAAA